MSDDLWRDVDEPDEPSPQIVSETESFLGRELNLLERNILGLGYCCDLTDVNVTLKIKRECHAPPYKIGSLVSIKSNTHEAFKSLKDDGPVDSIPVSNEQTYSVIGKSWCLSKTIDNSVSLKDCKLMDVCLVLWYQLVSQRGEAFWLQYDSLKLIDDTFLVKSLRDRDLF